MYFRRSLCTLIALGSLLSWHNPLVGGPTDLIERISRYSELDPNIFDMVYFKGHESAFIIGNNFFNIGGEFEVAINGEQVPHIIINENLIEVGVDSTWNNWSRRLNYIRIQDGPVASGLWPLSFPETYDGPLNLLIRNWSGAPRPLWTLTHTSLSRLKNGPRVPSTTKQVEMTHERVNDAVRAAFGISLQDSLAFMSGARAYVYCVHQYLVAARAVLPEVRRSPQPLGMPPGLPPYALLSPLAPLPHWGRAAAADDEGDPARLRGPRLSGDALQPLTVPAVGLTLPAWDSAAAPTGGTGRSRVLSAPASVPPARTTTRMVNPPGKKRAHGNPANLPAPKRPRPAALPDALLNPAQPQFTMAFRLNSQAPEQVYLIGNGFHQGMDGGDLRINGQSVRGRMLGKSSFLVFDYKGYESEDPLRVSVGTSPAEAEVELWRIDSFEALRPSASPSATSASQAMERSLPPEARAQILTHFAPASWTYESVEEPEDAPTA